jgi:ABC-type multidrug transport system fused ATPase/permease subunit
VNPAVSSATHERLSSLVFRLSSYASRRRRQQFLLLFVLTVASSAAEVLSLGSIVPFIGVLTQPERALTYPGVTPLVRLLGVASPRELVLPLTVLFVSAAISAGALRLLLTWASIRLANATGVDLSVQVYRRTLYQPYQVHVSRSSSEIISAITQKVATASSVLLSVTIIVTSSMLLIAILLTMVAIDPIVATVALVSFGSGYAAIAWQTRHRLRRNSHRIAEEQTAVIKTLQEGLGGIRDVLIDGTQDVYCRAYEKATQTLQRATSENAYINQAPRFAMESLGMALVAIVAYIVSRQSNNVGATLPVLGALGLGAQRLLPLLQQLYNNWSSVAGSHAALDDVLALLAQPLPDDANAPPPTPLVFHDSITFQDVSFRYAESEPYVLEKLTLRLPKGSRTGFVGKTGSGKSTALDLLMCLLDPTHGEVLVDGQPIQLERRRAWQLTIAHVPQNIFLADATIAENIAFGVPADQIDFDRVRDVAARAQIADFIEGRPEGYSSFVGERGVRLSGGQRQRIGIARALYKRASVLIFDEATSALDTETEMAVIKAIENLDQSLTIVFVAHRLTTLEHCDTIVRLEHGRIVKSES